jgi:hypothetical protein
VGFGWANSWVLPTTGDVEVTFTDQRPTTVMIAGQAVLWLVVIVIGWTGRRRRLRRGPVDTRSRRERRAQTEAERQARAEARDRRRRDELDDDFWART